MYSILEMDENYNVEEISSEELVSIMALQGTNETTHHEQEVMEDSAPSNDQENFSQRLSELANAPVPDWLINKV